MTHPPDMYQLPPIPLQAHFEGAGRALASIPDQLASGICENLQEVFTTLPDTRRAYLHTTSRKLPQESELQVRVEEIVSDSRYCDLRSWRTRATHRFDKKAMLDGMWVVEVPDDCSDPVTERDLTSYIEIMINYGGGIIEQMPLLSDLTLQLKESFG